MSGPAGSVPFDARPLIDPVDRMEVRDFVRHIMQRGGMQKSHESLLKILPVVIGAFFVISFGFVFVQILASILASFAGTSGSGGAIVIGVIGSVLPVVVMGGAIAAVVLFWRRGSLRRDERWFRLDRFATANGMTYVPGLSSPQLPGMIFTVGGSRASTDLVRGAQPRFVEFGNHQYTTGSGKNRTTHRWGYVAIKLDVPLPHIVLDATGNNGLFSSNLPMTFDKDQRLGLEGDFDEYFSLYCPAGYERDALYLFTPDIMARFIDNAAALDVEIVDDWLFLYGKREFAGLDPATWAWLFSVVAALLDKFAQWARWRDERLQADAAATTTGVVSGPSIDGGAYATATALPFAAPSQSLRPPPGVALTGRRLKRGIPWPAVIVFGFFFAFWLAGQFGVLDLLFGR